MVRWIAYFPAELLAEVDAWAESKGIAKRADAMRQLLRKALDAERAKSPAKGAKRLTVAELAELEQLIEATGAEDLETAIRQARRSVHAVNSGEAESEKPARKPKTMSERMASLVRKGSG